MIPCVAFSPDGKRIATACTDGTYSALGAFVWEVESGRKLAGPLMHRDGVHLVEFSPDGRFVATAGEDAVVRVWNASTGLPVTPALPLRTRALSMVFSPDSRRIAAGNVSGIVRFWSVDTGEPLTPPIPHTDRVIKVSFVSAGEGLLTVSSDGFARILDISRCDEPIDRLGRKAGILSSHQLEFQTELVPLGRAAIADSWRHLRPE